MYSIICGTDTDDPSRGAARGGGFFYREPTRKHQSELPVNNDTPVDSGGKGLFGWVVGGGLLRFPKELRTKKLPLIGSF